MTVAIDTSVAVALLVQSHHDHASAVRWWDGQEVALSGHALAETYSVLTRLPGNARLAPADAAQLLDARFSPPLALSISRTRKLPGTLSRLGIAGNAVYDTGAAPDDHLGPGGPLRDRADVLTRRDAYCGQHAEEGFR